MNISAPYKILRRMLYLSILYSHSVPYSVSHLYSGVFNMILTDKTIEETPYEHRTHSHRVRILSRIVAVFPLPC